jgi:hypothetical protein
MLLAGDFHAIQHSICVPYIISGNRHYFMRFFCSTVSVYLHRCSVCSSVNASMGNVQNRFLLSLGAPVDEAEI